MPDATRTLRARTVVVDAARDADVPIVFIQEIHHRSKADYGRELDGDENIHCLDGEPGTPLAWEEMGMRETDFFIQKQRYSAFFGTGLEIMLKAFKAETVIMVGGFTDVCVHCTFADGHQHDYHCRVVDDCVAGSSPAAHEASLRAMEYLQHGALRSSTEIINTLANRAGKRS
ncbi:MAG: cysteine hydrolase family protein [Sodalis sp. (in: enterobacteria)]|uniref:cysteine hydrolase family protein n=1 Tax=Sodalis sp. (in: enterobacteria) TaxID=1898979 RepID=UPI0039E306C7